MLKSLITDLSDWPDEDSIGETSSVDTCTDSSFVGLELRLKVRFLLIIRHTGSAVLTRPVCVPPDICPGPGDPSRSDGGMRLPGAAGPAPDGVRSSVPAGWLYRN